MKKNIWLSLLILCIANSAFAQNITPKASLPRTGINGEIGFNTLKAEEPKKLIPEKKIKFSSTKKILTINDLDMQNIANEIGDSLLDERENTLADLRILWEAAIEKSETIRFAIMKLSNPDGDKENKGVIKTILSPLASVAPIIGSGLSSPVVGGGSIIGGGLLSSILSDDSAINHQLSRVTDADLIILAQEIDNLQQKLVNLYQHYIGSREKLHFADKVVDNRYKYYISAQKLTPEAIAVADVFYRESLDLQYRARQEVLSSRAALEQFVGNNVIIALDKNINSRISNLPK